VGVVSLGLALFWYRFRSRTPGPVLVDELSRKELDAFERSTDQIGFAVRLEGACHQRRRVPPRELSIDLVADERCIKPGTIEPTTKLFFETRVGNQGCGVTYYEQ